MVGGIEQSGEGHDVLETGGTGGDDGFLENGEDFGMVAFVIHAALEVVRFGGGANEAGSFQEGELISVEEFDSGDAELLGMADEVLGSPLGTDGEGPCGDDLLDSAFASDLVLSKNW